MLGPSERLEGAVTVALYALVYGIALQVVRRIGDVRRLAAALGIGAALMAAYGLVQFAGLDPADYSHEAFGFSLRRAFATFGNPNFLAALLVLALPVVGALALQAVSRRSRIAWSAGAVLVGAALFATFTRGAWLAALAEAGIAVYLWRSRRPAARSGTSVALLLGVAVVLLALIAASLLTTGETNVATRVASAFDRNDSVGERLLIVGVAVDAVAHRPVLGYGPDTFLPAFRAWRTNAYVAEFGADVAINNAHSWLLQYLVTLGIPGAFLLAAALALALVRAWPRRPAAGETPPGSVLMAAVWTGCLGLVIHLAFNVGVLGATLPFFALLGALAAPRAREIALPLPAALATAAVFSVLVLVTAVASVVLMGADASYLASRRAYYGEAPGDAAALAQRASALDPLSVKYARGLAQAHARAVETAITRGEQAEAVRAAYGTASADFDRVLALCPNDYPAHAWLAAMQARVGNYLHDDGVLQASRETARQAEALDAQHVAVSALAGGDTSIAAIWRAESVSPLP